ncbi:hypothetical protein KSP40_PGU009929 [Platanthera guangdongensis]|uniref:Uncharacterized protein n=1 Tax=Platanthera guangdongensis TaxID=2320717 RepID=A0ABR2LTI7_9ASPA
MDEKWKLSKNKSSRSSSLPAARTRTRTVAGSDDGHPSFTSRCTNVVKEQRSRFYILRRCVKMLVCWRDYP